MILSRLSTTAGVLDPVRTVAPGTRVVTSVAARTVDVLTDPALWTRLSRRGAELRTEHFGLGSTPAGLQLAVGHV